MLPSANGERYMTKFVAMMTSNQILGGKAVDYSFFFLTRMKISTIECCSAPMAKAHEALKY